MKIWATSGDHDSSASQNASVHSNWSRYRNVVQELAFQLFHTITWFGNNILTILDVSQDNLVCISFPCMVWTFQSGGRHKKIIQLRIMGIFFEFCNHYLKKPKSASAS